MPLPVTTQHRPKRGHAGVWFGLVRTGGLTDNVCAEVAHVVVVAGREVDDLVRPEMEARRLTGTRNRAGTRAAKGPNRAGLIPLFTIDGAAGEVLVAQVDL